MADKTNFQAKTYTNRKGEVKLQVSGAVDKFQGVLDKDKELTADLLKMIRAAVKE